MNNKRCKNCNKKLSAKRIKDVISKRDKDLSRKDHSIYCDNTCFKAYRKKKAIENNRCPECGGPWKNRERGNYRCGECREIAFSSRYYDSDIIKLVLLNPGVGKRYFVYNLGYTSVIYAKALELIEFLEAIGEFHKVDYVSILETPVRMRKMKVRDLTPELRRFANNKRTSAPSRIVLKRRAREQGRDTSEVGGTHVNTYVPAEFIWGDVKEMSKY